MPMNRWGLNAPTIGNSHWGAFNKSGSERKITTFSVNDAFKSIGLYYRKPPRLCEHVQWWFYIVTVLMILGACAPPGWADSTQGADPVEDAMARVQAHSMFNKLGRGVSNVVGGWLEVPANIAQRYVENDTAGSLFTGLAYGLVKGVARTGVGIYETVTFILPYPNQYAPILPTLPYFTKKAGRRPLLLE